MAMNMVMIFQNHCASTPRMSDRVVGDRELECRAVTKLTWIQEECQEG